MLLKALNEDNSLDKDLLQKAVSELETDVNYMQEQKEYKRQRKVRAAKLSQIQ